MKTLELTPDEEAIVVALLWRFRFTLARMTRQRETVHQMPAEDAPAIPSEIREAVDVIFGGIDEDIPEMSASVRSEFAEKTRVIDSILRKLCDEADELLRPLVQ